MRVAVMGAGAMGGVFGGRLAEAGHEVLLVDVSPSIVASVEEHGLRLVENGEERSVKVAVTSDPTAESVMDVVAFFVKSYHTADAAALASPIVDEDTTVVSLQNGWGNGETLAEVFDTNQIVVGVTYHSATVLETARIAHTGEGATFVGPYIGNSCARAEAFAASLRGAGFEIDVGMHVRKEIWKKLTLNAATLPIAALTRLTACELGEPGSILDLVDGLAAEAVAVATACGLDIDLDERLETIHATLDRAGPGRPSMLQDIEANRRTEIDVVTGAVVREAARAGIDVPLNTALYALVSGLERGLHLV